MKKSQRKHYSADLKAKVALEAIKGHRTIHLMIGNFLSRESGKPSRQTQSSVAISMSSRPYWSRYTAPLPRSAVEVRLREKRRSLAQDLVRALQFTILPLQFFQLLRFIGPQSSTLSLFSLELVDPLPQCLDCTADLRCDRRYCRPLRRVLPLVFQHQADCTLTDFWWISAWSSHNDSRPLKKWSLPETRDGSTPVGSGKPRQVLTWGPSGLASA